MKESPTYREILEEGAGQGIRDSIIDALNIRFGDVPPEITHELAEIADLEALRHLHRLAVRCENLADFRAQMPSVVTT